MLISSPGEGEGGRIESAVQFNVTSHFCLLQSRINLSCLASKISTDYLNVWPGIHILMISCIFSFNYFRVIFGAKKNDS